MTISENTPVSSNSNTLKAEIESVVAFSGHTETLPSGETIYYPKAEEVNLVVLNGGRK